MPKLISPKEYLERLAAGESDEQIFIGDGGAYKAKLVGPDATATASTVVDRGIDFTISTAAVDRYSDTVSLGGWRTKNYEGNPVVLWAHDDSIPAIARGTNLRIEGRGLRSTAVFAEREIHPLADTVYQLVKGKFINASSVGFIPLAAKQASAKDRPFGLDITEQELLEWSVCNIPANPQCLVDARSFGIDTAPLIGWAERVLDNGSMLMIPKSELEALRKAAGAPTVYASAALPKPKIKSLWHIAWLADILMDLDILEDCVEWETSMEEDGSVIADRLKSELQSLGQILIDMTIEEVTEFLADPDAADAGATGGLVELSARAARMQVLKSLVKADEQVIGAVLEALAPKEKPGLVDLLSIKTGIAIAKAGKVLSSDNEKKLREAHEMLTKGCETIMGVLGAAAPADDTQEKSQTAGADDHARNRRLREAEALRLAV